MIDFSDLEDAFLFVGSDQPFMNSAIVNKRTGETFYQSELSGIDDFPENFEGDNFIEIPHKNDLDLGRDLVFERPCQCAYGLEPGQYEVHKYFALGISPLLPCVRWE